MYQDSFKHLTTFSSGALVVSATVVKALFPNPAGVTVLELSFAFFLLGAATATLGLWMAPESLEATNALEANTPTARARLRIYLTVSVSTSYLGVLLYLRLRRV